MSNPTPLTLSADDAGVAEAAEILRAGGLVAFPTETVYGLGADATNPKAVRAIFAAKDRPAKNPLIVHVDSLEMARRLAEMPEAAERMAAAFWPGPLTLVLPLAEGHALAPEIAAGLTTVALRMPGSELARALISAVGRPLAAPSANPSGRVSATRPEHVVAGLGGRVDAVLDDGPCPLGVESTIVGFEPEPTLLRPGALPLEDLAACLGAEIALRDEGAAISAPGQMTLHYAPRAVLRLNVLTPDPGETLLGFGSVVAPFNLSPAGNLREAAANLFHMLHDLDARGIERIGISPIPDVGIGRAINDRLRRASAPRG